MENFWKEYTISLPANKEFVYDIQNKNTNCIVIRNHNLTNVKAGLKPHAYEILINPKRTGLLNRPFPLEYIYLFTDKKTPVTIVETVIQNPVNNFIQQKTSKNIIIQNTPKVCEKDAFKTLSIFHSEHCPPRRRNSMQPYPFNVTLDCGIYGRPLVNIVFAAAGMPTWFSIGFSNDNINYFYPYTNLQTGGTPYRFLLYYPPKFVRKHITLINAFRYVRVSTILYRFTTRGHRIFIQISGTRCQIKNNRNKVSKKDGP